MRENIDLPAAGTLSRTSRVNVISFSAQFAKPNTAPAFLALGHAFFTLKPERNANALGHKRW